MFIVQRSQHNPLITPQREHSWEALATFNWCPIASGKEIHAFYRAQSLPEPYKGTELSVSSIGHAVSSDGEHFEERKLFIEPQEAWDMFGCEDPRVTKIGSKYYIFYTALSGHPFNSEVIKVGLATTKDCSKILERKLVTPFNAKAMCLFPEKINGKLTAMLAVNTDKPPAKIAIRTFESEEEIWDHEKWNEWYATLDDHVLNLKRSDNDHVEVGAPPIKTDRGWLMIYAYIQNYFSDQKIFGIEAALLDLEDPRKVVARTKHAFMTPGLEYEKYGLIPNIVFPSGALVRGKYLEIYYGAADTSCCQARVHLENLLDSMTRTGDAAPVKRFSTNPLLSPVPDHEWESKFVLNPGVIDLKGTVYILYRAMGQDDTSVIGLATSKDGIHIDERLAEPIYVPREEFEQKKNPGNSGCEDPRIVKINERLYMAYTAFDAVHQPQIAVTSILEKDFLDRKWNWSKPFTISDPSLMDKDASILPQKLKRKYYMVFHRVGVSICADMVPKMQLGEFKLNKCIQMIQPREGMWDAVKVGIAAPPILTKKGWLLLYHGVGSDHGYRVGAALLDKTDPTNVLGVTAMPIFEPEESYEKNGLMPNVVFPCGAIERDGTVYFYYGAADTVVAGAQVEVATLLRMFE